MDAFDIFKKLTKGIKYVRPKEQKLNPDKTPKSEQIDIKIEKDEVSNKENNKQNLAQDDSITLLSGMSQNNTKEQNGKKRKCPLDPNEIERKKRLLEQEQINHYRNINNIGVVGKKVPEAAKSFDDFKVDSDIVINLQKCGYKEPTPIQKQAVPIMLETPKSEQIDIKIEKDEVSNKENNKQNLAQDDSITLLSGMSQNNTKEQNGKKRKCPLDPNEIERKKRLLEQEQINHYRNINNIGVVGKKVPEAAKSFDDFKVDSDIVINLQKCGYKEPTPIQKQAVPIMLEGRPLLACAPTGSGKTAAFLVPIIQSLKKSRKKGFRALILCPTRELAKQIQRECIRLSEGREFRVHIISKIKKALTQYGPHSNKKFDILITTPNRLCFLLKQDPPALSLANVKWLVIDEADKLFEEGNNSFRDQMQNILSACNHPSRKIAMFSATYTAVVAKWCVKNMKGLIRLTVGHRNAAVDTIDQELLFVGNEQGKLLAFRDLVKQGITPPVLVFVQSKERAQQLFTELMYDGINVDAIHADRTQNQRDQTVQNFREGKVWILICTELMARGVDFKGVNLVINYDFPPSAISYVHRIGRTGRAGRKGKAVTFFTKDDTVNLRSIAHILKNSDCDVPEYMLTMKKQPKSEVKKMLKSAPVREDITTKPLYDRIQGSKKKKFREIAKKFKKTRQDADKEKISKNPKILNNRNNEKFSKKKIKTKSEENKKKKFEKNKKVRISAGKLVDSKKNKRKKLEKTSKLTKK